MSHKILLIEDDEITANLVRFLVERQGHQFHWAANGSAGLEMARELVPDALILDVLLPYLDGFSLLSEIRGHEATAGIPVLMLTGKTRESDIVQALDMGANDYLLKPFQPAELTARLNRLLRAVK
jgi:DNA-binding response OmpR family regulator